MTEMREQEQTETRIDRQRKVSWKKVGAVAFALVLGGGVWQFKSKERGCKPFTVFAQGRWDPLGAAVRAAPDLESEKVGAVKANDPITVDGYVETGKASYDQNPDIFLGDTWYHIYEGDTDTPDRFVNNAAVRGEVTVYDPMSEDGGVPAPAPNGCEMSISR